MSKRLRLTRYKVQCSICKKQVYSEYKDEHARTQHKDQKVTFSTVTIKGQSTLGFSTIPPLSESSSSNIENADFDTNNLTSFENPDCNIQLDVLDSTESEEPPPESDDESQPPYFPSIDFHSSVSSPSTNSDDDASGQVLETDYDNEDRAISAAHTTACTESVADEMIISDDDCNEAVSLDPLNESNDAPLEVTTPDAPKQPRMNEYAPRTFGKESFKRDFQPAWFDKYSWLGFSVDKSCGYCYACERFGSTKSFEYRNWKKPKRLKKHAKSQAHKTAFVKWMSHEAQLKSRKSIASMMDENHQRMVVRNREYLRVIIECLLFTAQQNIPQRGHEESRQNLEQASDFNCGNFLELLHLRCKDISWLGDMLDSQLGVHHQWTASSIQNELLKIMADQTLELILTDVRASEYFAVIMDETSDISRKEQVSLCLSYLLEGEKKEAFVGFFGTNSTSGEDLYNLLCEAMKQFDLDMKNIVAECFDGASNMCGEYKGVATRMLETSPLSIYIHCYGHIINLALKDTLENVPVVRNTLGVLQSLYNFIEASTKRHGLFEAFNDGKDYLLLSLKSQSETRWSCRWEAVKAVYEQLERIIGYLLQLSSDKNSDSKTYTGARNLLRSVLDFDFVWGLCVLRAVLMNTSNLNSYVQGKQLDIFSLRKTAEMTIETLRRCRTDEHAKNTWDLAMVRSREIKELIKDNPLFDFEGPKVPRLQRIHLRLQALMGEEGDAEDHVFHEAFDLYRVNTYFNSLDLAINELEARFSENDLAILSAMCDIIMNVNPSEGSFRAVSEQYDIDCDMLMVEHDLFVSFRNAFPDANLDSPCEVLKRLYENDHIKFLPHFSKLVRIFNVIPATSCSAERSFSALRRLKTYIRSTMGQDRLSHLAFLSIE